MKNKEINKVIFEAIEVWGADAQLEMAIEEMAELIFALQKLKRKRGKPYLEKIKAVQEEVADVTLMMKQLKNMFGENKINSLIDSKVIRLKERLNEPKKGN